MTTDQLSEIAATLAAPPTIDLAGVGEVADALGVDWVWIDAAHPRPAMRIDAGHHRVLVTATATGIRWHALDTVAVADEIGSWASAADVLATLATLARADDPFAP